MGMSTSVYGIVPADDKFKKMKAIFDLCEEQGIEIPEEVIEFFNNEPPTEDGVKIYMDGFDSVKKYTNDYQSGYEIHVDKIPNDIKIIRVVNSW